MVMCELCFWCREVFFPLCTARELCPYFAFSVKLLVVDRSQFHQPLRIIVAMLSHISQPARKSVLAYSGHHIPSHCFALYANKCGIILETKFSSFALLNVYKAWQQKFSFPTCFQLPGDEANWTKTVFHCCLTGSCESIYSLTAMRQNGPWKTGTSRSLRELHGTPSWFFKFWQCKKKDHTFFKRFL